MIEDEMVGWHPALNGHKFEQSPGIGDGQGSLVCCMQSMGSQSQTTEQLNEQPQGFPGGASGKESICQCRSLKRHGLDSWVRKIPWRRAWKPPPIFLLGESHGQTKLAGQSPWGHRESDTTEVTQHTHMDYLREMSFSKQKRKEHIS